ncbi:cobalamin biosynthesis protein [Granulicella sp. L60]|uniref:cobalamin biosynthesis protein n=1 Tax=Granulicella sp. L60 TaxID=1641866 RepID=UPI00131AA8FE|nr:cobalamin biosynthesis protein [Granulicella sp. L60]
MTQQIAIGIGASSKAVAQDILTLIQSCILKVDAATTASTTQHPTIPTILATLDRRADIASVVASTLGLRLVLFPATVLAEVRGVKTISSIAARTTGSPSIAEAAALAALGDRAHLLLERQTGNQCTCAMAVLP